VLKTAQKEHINLPINHANHAHRIVFLVLLTVNVIDVIQAVIYGKESVSTHVQLEPTHTELFALNVLYHVPAVSLHHIVLVVSLDLNLHKQFVKKVVLMELMKKMEFAILAYQTVINVLLLELVTNAKMDMNSLKEPALRCAHHHTIHPVMNAKNVQKTVQPAPILQLALYAQMALYLHKDNASRHAQQDNMLSMDNALNAHQIVLLALQAILVLAAHLDSISMQALALIDAQLLNLIKMVFVTLVVKIVILAQIKTNVQLAQVDIITKEENAFQLVLKVITPKTVDANNVLLTVMSVLMIKIA